MKICLLLNSLQSAQISCSDIQIAITSHTMRNYGGFIKLPVCPTGTI